MFSSDDRVFASPAAEPAAALVITVGASVVRVLDVVRVVPGAPSGVGRKKVEA